jgi:hypothetical protein
LQIADASSQQLAEQAGRKAVHPAYHYRIKIMVLSTTALLLIVVLLILVLGVVPSWSHSRSWGYAPSGTLGAILVIVLIFALLGYL